MAQACERRPRSGGSLLCLLAVQKSNGIVDGEAGKGCQRTKDKPPCESEGVVERLYPAFTKVAKPVPNRAATIETGVFGEEATKPDREPSGYKQRG
jgi:hypothetical protein